MATMVTTSAYRPSARRADPALLFSRTKCCSHCYYIMQPVYDYKYIYIYIYI